jgi:CheY-like chemotaxis protein
VGRGSEFWVDLPREHTGPAGPVPAEAGAGSAAVPARVPGAKVMYVEDNPVNMSLMQTIIERHDGLQLLGATSAAAGLELARAQQPDLILLDITLPDMDGYALLARLRAEAGTRDIPVVAVTAKAMPSDAQRVRDAGFDEYLTKPIDLKVIDAVLERMLSRNADARPA